MPVNTKKVTGRRSVRYESLEDFYADAERMAGVDVQPLGNWSPGQIYEHMARSLDSSIDGVGSSMPAPVRWMMTLLMKRKFLEKEIPPGFNTTAQYEPDATSAADGLASLKRAIARQHEEPQRVEHPVFGSIGREGWAKFHLRHAEMHMSFLTEAQAARRKPNTSALAKQ